VSGSCGSDGSGLRRLTPNAIRAAHPAWSPDGKRIVFVGSPADHDFAFDLYVMRADGSGLRRLVKLPGGAEAQDWSPDGRTIVFAQFDSRTLVSDIYAVGTNGRGLRRLTRTPGDDTSPDWSPDGRLIASGGMDDVLRLGPEAEVGGEMRASLSAWLSRSRGSWASG